MSRCSSEFCLVFPRLFRLLQEQFRIIVVTNQSGIARGLISEEGLLDVHVELVRRLSCQGAYVDGLYYCPHLPEAAVPAYAAACDCRKPRPGMLLRGAKRWDIDLTRSYMVGDTLRDMEAACAAGVSAVMIGEGPSGPPGRCMMARDLEEAARLILADVEAVPSEVEAMGTVGPALYKSCGVAAP